ncbi:MAG: hypothetical protein HY240_05845 [Actinobacteria bacterium]|nr:hypothetical protein [Actinomycetota bacterium]
MSTGLYGRSSGGSVAGVVVVAGLVGALASGVLWLHEVNPHSDIVRFVTTRLLGSTDGWGALVTVAAVAGGLGLLVAILGTIGSRTRGGGAVFGIVLSLLALSYPFAYLAQQIARPFTSGGPLGRS